MFQNLQRGSQVYLLHKGMTPYMEMGVVEQMPNLPMSYYPNLPMMPLDLTVRVGERVITYKQLPPTAESASVVEQTSGEEVCVACSKDSIDNEALRLMQQSIDTINSVPMHEKRVEICKGIHEQLNPEKVREAQQAQEIDELKSQLADMKTMMVDLTNQLKGRNNSSH